jgi:drug/metabolite transporter (DMT)-like permease
VVAATFLALASAGLHATWNLLLKRSPAEDRVLASWGLYVAGGLLVLPVVVALGGPGRGAAGWLALSAVVHVGYITALVAAYHHGDFSLAYPLARGGGALVAAIGGAAILGDDLPLAAWVAVAVAAAGLASLVGPGRAAANLRDALLTALAIGTYTLVDAKGARAADDALAYGLATATASAVALSVVHLARGRGRSLVASTWAQRRRWALGGACMAVAYGLVVSALRLAPVGYVAMLRESSVVLGAGIGWLWLKEPLGGRRLVSSVVILLGLLGLVAATL